MSVQFIVVYHPNWSSIIPQAIATTLALSLCICAWRHRKMPGVSSFVLLMAAVSFWTATDALQGLSGKYIHEIIWLQIGIIGPASVPPLWLNFALRYTGLSTKTPARTMLCLAAIPVVTVIISFSTPSSRLLWSKTEWFKTGLGPSITDYGPWFWVHAVYSYIVCLLGVSLFGILSMRKPRLYRKQALIVIAAAIVPLTASLIRSLQLTTYDATSICFSLSGLILAVGSLRLGMLDVIPVARDAVIESLCEGVIVLDIAERVIDINPAAEQIFGLQTSSAIGQPLAKAFASWPDMIRYCAPMKEVQTEISAEVDGSRHYYSLTAIPQMNKHGQPSGLLVILHDVTELRESNRQLRELSRLKEDLTNMIVHDLRTPLASMTTGLTAIERMGELNSCQQEMLSMGVNRGRILLGMINDLLDINKMEHGFLQLDLCRMDINKTINSVVLQMASLASEKQQSLECKVADGIESITADEGLISRTIANLIGNAIRFTPERGTITLAVQESQDKSSILFSVSDTGEGIPEEALERIFEKFGQVETRKSGQKLSTGLGLTLCKMAVEAHGGRIWVASELEKGSTFYFTLPALQ